MPVEATTAPGELGEEAAVDQRYFGDQEWREDRDLVVALDIGDDAGDGDFGAGAAGGGDRHQGRESALRTCQRLPSPGYRCPGCASTAPAALAVSMELPPPTPRKPSQPSDS